MSDADHARQFILAQRGVCVVGSIPWSEPAGSPGTTPPDRTDAIPLGQPGTPSSAIVKEHLSFEELVQCISPSHTAMLINACASDYINEQFAEALSRLVWLKAVLKTVSNRSSGAEPTEADLQRYRSQSASVDALLQQLTLGLDYYGQPLNHVPLVSVEYYNPLINQLLLYGRSIEASYLAYQKARNDQAVAASAFRTTMTQALQLVDRMQDQSAQLLAQQEPTLQAIERLGDALNATWEELMGAEQKFKEAVERQSQGCSFGQLATIGACVATLISSGGTAVAAIGPALAALKKEPLKYDDKTPVLDDFKGFKYKVNTVVTVGKDVASFSDAYSKVKDSIRPSTGPLPALPGDEAKIVASADDIEAQLKPFLDMPEVQHEAQQYRAMLRNFVAQSEARNNKILEYNNIIVNWQKLQAAIGQTQLEADAAQTSYAATQNPFIADAANFMHKAWMDSKSNLISLIYQLNRAYQYYSLNSSSFSVTDFSIAAIEDAAQSSLSLYTNAFQNFGSQPANIKGKQIDLLPHIAKGALDKFKKSKKLVVSIPPDEPSLQAYSNLLVTRIGLVLIGPNGPVKDLQVNITHEGRSLIFDQSGRPHTFSHVAITTPYELQAGKVVSDGAIAIDKDYVGVSPYGPWTIHINSVDQAILEKVKGIALSFDGKGRGRA